VNNAVDVVAAALAAEPDMLRQWQEFKQQQVARTSMERSAAQDKGMPAAVSSVVVATELMQKASRQLQHLYAHVQHMYAAYAAASVWCMRQLQHAYGTCSTTPCWCAGHASLAMFTVA
jgi:hypothetical protein